MNSGLMVGAIFERSKVNSLSGLSFFHLVFAVKNGMNRIELHRV